MQLAGQVALGVYAALLAAGGVIGYVKAGSRPSLIAGLASGVAALAILLISMWQTRLGFGLGLALAAALVALFVLRYRKTGKFLPAGLLAAISLVVGLVMAALLLPVT